MRVAVISESFLPSVNGVTNSVLRVCEQLQRRGSQVLVVAPGPGPEAYAGARVVRAPSVPLPGHPEFRLSRPWPLLGRTLREFRPDVVHLASPAVLGAQAAYTARRLGVPAVAVYQTDLVGFAARHGLAGTEATLWRYLRRVHAQARRTLAPSRHAVDVLRRNGVQRVVRWGRGVDDVTFCPAHRSDGWRARLAPAGEVVLGYIGRLAPEKEVDLLTGLRDLPGARLVVVGDGPRRKALERQLPGVAFLGQQSGSQLSTAFASIDVFVHPGSSETFCQAAQEALASGVPVVAPAAGGLLDLVDPGADRAAVRPRVGTRVQELGRAAGPRPGRPAPHGRGGPAVRPAPHVGRDRGRAGDALRPGDGRYAPRRRGSGGMTRIVQVANFVAPGSGGLRTTLRHLAEGYAAAGHDVVQVLPGARDQVEQTAWGRRVQLRAPAVPGTGYRLLSDVRRVGRTLETLAPDRLEVHDRTTLRGLGCWARSRGVPSLVVSHERLDRWLRQWLSPRLPLDSIADRWNAGLADGFDAVLCTTAWAAAEFTRLGTAVRQVPLGVDLDRFRPDRSGRPELAGHSELMLALASWLSREKRPDLAVGAVAELGHRGHRVRLVVAGDGPLRTCLERQATGLPVTFAGYLVDRERLARLLGAADIVVAPGPVETFGLAALEALACGTPVVANVHSALPEVLGPAGRASPSTPRCFADAVEAVLATDERARRRAARQRAQQFPWRATVEGFLDVHGLARPAGQEPARVRVPA